MDNLFHGLCDGLDDADYDNLSMKYGSDGSKRGGEEEEEDDDDDEGSACTPMPDSNSHAAASGATKCTKTTSVTATSATSQPHQHSPSPPPLPPSFTFAEIFAGIGGFRLGLEPLGGR